MKKFIKGLTPPFILQLSQAMFRFGKGTGPYNMWTGNYTSWKEAARNSESYDLPVILEKVKKATLAVKNGEAAYERDSVLFSKAAYNWPLVSILLKIAQENHNAINLIDFGGSLGSSYFQNRNFLNKLSRFNWMVVEQDHFVSVGNEHIEDAVLRFSSDLQKAKDRSGANTLLLSSVLQYLEKPYEFLDGLESDPFEYLVVDRTIFVDLPEDRITVQSVPEEIYKASYPCWMLSRSKFLEYMDKQYNLHIDFDPYPGLTIDLGDARGFCEGFFFQRKKRNEN